jgi:8-oxo-dGTP diphosphatase
MSDPNNQSTKENPVGRFMVAVGAVIEYKNSGKILIVQRSKDLDWNPGQWEIGYGRLDQFENPQQALHREIKEELGLTDIEIVKILTTWQMFRGSKKADNELIGITFHCRTQTKQIKLSDEHSQYKWVEPEKALEMVKIEGIKRDVKAFLFITKIY